LFLSLQFPLSFPSRLRKRKEKERERQGRRESNYLKDFNPKEIYVPRYVLLVHTYRYINDYLAEDEIERGVEDTNTNN
jgi:hypothetical protein